MTTFVHCNVDGTIVWLHLYTVMLMVQLYDYICTLWCWWYSCMTVHLYTVTVYKCSHTTVPSTSQCTNVQSYNYTINITVYKCSHTTVPSTLQCTNVVIQLHHQHYSVQMWSYNFVWLYMCTLWCWWYSCMTTFVHCNVDGTVVWLYICTL
jgi:hypothetical protein